MLSKLLPFLAYLHFVAAISRSRPHVSYISQRSTSHSHCQQRRQIHKDQVLRLSFSLSIPNSVVDSAATHLQSISDPGLESFGQHWTMIQVNSWFASAPHQVRDLVHWLKESHILYENLALDVDHLVLDIEKRGAEKLLSTTFTEFICGANSYVFSDTYHLPESVACHVDFVTATKRKKKSPRRVKRHKAVSSVGATNSQRPKKARQVDCFKYTTPDCLRILYGIPSSTMSPHPNNSIGIYLSDWLSWRGDDLDQFFGDFQPDLVTHRPLMLPIDGGYRNPDLGSLPFHLEANLDFGLSMALSDPVPVTDIQVGDKFLRGNLNTMLFAFDENYYNTSFDPAIDPGYPNSRDNGGYNASDIGNRKPPLVISISWGQPEAKLPEKYVRRQCIEFLKLGLQGVTILASSGDFGPASNGGACADRDSYSLNATTGIFSPNFPASCPWVTAVGGTRLSAGNQTWKPGVEFPQETVWTRESSSSNRTATSGGGFSRIFKTPQYQSDAVRLYLEDSDQAEHLASLTAAGYLDPAGRGYPDISAVADSYLMYVLGELRHIHGTSASAPVLASMIAKINDARLHAGKGPVGFINPVLYGRADEFVRDVTTGFNAGCGVTEAYRATQGWDAATGLGTVDFGKLLELYLRLP